MSRYLQRLVRPVGAVAARPAPVAGLHEVEAFVEAPAHAGPAARAASPGDSRVPGAARDPFAPGASFPEVAAGSQALPHPALPVWPDAAAAPAPPPATLPLAWPALAASAAQASTAPHAAPTSQPATRPQAPAQASGRNASAPPPQLPGVATRPAPHLVTAGALATHDPRRIPLAPGLRATPARRTGPAASEAIAVASPASPTATQATDRVEVRIGRIDLTVRTPPPAPAVMAPPPPAPAPAPAPQAAPEGLRFSLHRHHLRWS